MIAMIKKALIYLILLIIPFSAFAKDEDQKPDPNDRIKVIGWLQPQFRLGYSSDLDGQKLRESSFAFNRARLGVIGNISSDFSYYFLTELSSFKNGPLVVKATISYNGLGNWAIISAGKFKHPFSMELNTSSRKLHTIYRSKVVSELSSPSVDYGMMISGNSGDLDLFGLSNKEILKYRLAIVNGSGKHVYDTDVYKDLVMKLNFSPYEFIDFGGSYRFGKRAPLIDPEQAAGKVVRYAADVTINYKNLLIQSEFVTGHDESYETVDDGTFLKNNLSLTDKSNGCFIQALYVMPIQLQPLIKFESYNGNLHGQEGADQSLTLGFNYFFNDQAKLQLNYIHHTYSKANLNQEDLLTDAVYLQFQLIF